MDSVVVWVLVLPSTVAFPAAELLRSATLGKSFSTRVPWSYDRMGL